MAGMPQLVNEGFFRWACRYWFERAHGHIPAGWALYMTPGHFELKDRR